MNLWIEVVILTWMVSLWKNKFLPYLYFVSISIMIKIEGLSLEYLELDGRVGTWKNDKNKFFPLYNVIYI